jgi:hypothetical protein
MKKFLSFFKTEKSKALELRADFRLGSDLPPPQQENEIFVRAEFLNLAGVDEPENDYFIYLTDFCRHFNAKGVHATFASFEHKGVYFFDPVAPVLSPNLLPKAIERISRYKARLELPISVRNYFDPQVNLQTFIPAADFFYELVTRSGANFICDVSSSISFAKAFGQEPEAQLKRMLEIERTSAFVRSIEEANLVKELGFKGTLMGFDRDLAGISVVCEGEFLSNDP